MLSKKSILITGGTGSFGKKLVQVLLKNYNLDRIVIFSRDELKQFEMQQEFNDDNMRYFIGDVRDFNRLKRAMKGVDIVIHAAAMKQVPASEHNPFEAVKTNVIGAQNVIDASMESKVKKVIALSTDKAASPINLYGATKLVSDKLFVAANNYTGWNDIKFSVVRYGNVMGSRGSVIPFFLKNKDKGVLTITDKRMTRFNITLDEGVKFVLNCLDKMWGGETFVPKIPSYNILDVARAIDPNCKHHEIGIRPGEKLHEEMITETDSLNCIEFDNYYVILPSIKLWDINKFKNESSQFKGKKTQFGFSYNSKTNSSFLSIDDLKNLIRDNI